MEWLSVFKHLLPDARAWRLTIDKALRQFFEGLAGLPADVRTFFDNVYTDLDPQLTRFLELWEKQFNLVDNGLTEQERRDRLAGAWAALGGQSPRYIQDTLQAAGFDVYVHDFWVPGTEPAIGVQGCATVRNPNTYLTGGTAGSNLDMFDGQVIAQDGGVNSQDGATNSPVGYPLVNKILTQAFLGDGAVAMQDGGVRAQDGSILGFSPKTYQLPTDATKWPFFLYIGGSTFPNQATVPASRRDEFEDLCLKICPAHLWLGILTTYS